MKWLFPENQDDDLVEWLYKTRSITDKNKFHNAGFDDLHDPFLMHDMAKAVDHILKCVKDNKKIFIHGDFDVDGITATSILWKFLKKELNADVIPFVPDRFTDGYGLSEDTVEKIINDAGQLIISVDCGVKDIDLVNRYANKIDFIITDHHTVREYDKSNKLEGSKKVGKYSVSSKAKAVVHPVLSKEYPFKEICGALVSWKLCSALNSKAGLGIDMQKYLDLAAIGTICDIMPLVDENRIVVKLGLEQLKQTQNIGLKSLAKVANIDLKTIDTYHIGFILGPRLNASGRIGSAMDAVRLLCTDSLNFAGELAMKLEQLNRKRQELTKEYLELAEKKVKAIQDNKVLFVYGDEWPEGIIGLIAGRLAEKYNRPVIAGSVKNNILKASARSSESFHIANNLKLLNDYLIAHGGHAQAAGLSLDIENIDKFYTALLSLADKDLGDFDMERTMKIEGIIDPLRINIDFVRTLMNFAPFGNKNERPLLAFKNVKIQNFKTMGSSNNHIKFAISQSDLEFVAFDRLDLLDVLKSDAVDIAGNIEINEWNGRVKICFKVKDIRIAE